MKEQLAIEVAGQKSVELGSCAWCGKDGVEEIILERDRYGIQDGRRILRKRAILATVCVNHRKILEEQPVFYTCGCTYVEGEDLCSKHLRKLKRR